MPKRWNYQDEDEYRIPEGMSRVGYDADTSQYVFKDDKGAFYMSAPGSRYGVLKPMADPAISVENERPETFNHQDGKERLIPRSPRLPDEETPRSFHDMIPSNLITSPTTLPDEQPQTRAFPGFAALVSPTSAKHASSESTGDTTAPTLGNTLRNSVKSLKRSMTSVTKKKKATRARAMSSVEGARLGTDANSVASGLVEKSEKDY